MSAPGQQEHDCLGSAKTLTAIQRQRFYLGTSSTRQSLPEQDFCQWNCRSFEASGMISAQHCLRLLKNASSIIALLDTFPDELHGAAPAFLCLSFLYHIIVRFGL